MAVFGLGAVGLSVIQGGRGRGGWAAWRMGSQDLGYVVTLPETNIGREHRPLEKEITIGKPPC